MIYHKINKQFTNNSKVFYGSRNEKIDVNLKLNEIFKTKGYKNVTMETIEGTFDKILVGKNNEYVLTTSNDLIKISDIKDIKLK